MDPEKKSDAENLQREEIAALKKQLLELQNSLTALISNVDTEQDLIALGPSMNNLCTHTTKVTATLSTLSQKALENISQKQKAWQEVQEKLKGEAEKAPKIITFNVGGKVFSIAKEHLLQQNDSYFSALLSSGQWKPDTNGQYYIDRSPTYFKVILHYLRTGRLEVKYHHGEKWENLKAELDYFQIKLPPSKLTPITIMTEKEEWQVKEWLRHWYAGRLGSILYQGTMHGFKAADFHKRCDNQGSTVVVIQTDQGYVFGGHTTRSWESPRQAQGLSWLKHFLFTLRNPQNTPPMQLRFNETSPAKYAQVNDSMMGPSFGSSLQIGDNSDVESSSSSVLGGNYGDKSQADLLTGATTFKVREIQVFCVYPPTDRE